MASPPASDEQPKIKSYTGGWGKDSGSSVSASRLQSRLDAFTPDQLKKTADLAKPVEASFVAVGRSVEGLEILKDRLVEVRVTNPNPYKAIFRGREYRTNVIISPIYKTLEDGTWKVAGADMCGTGVRDWEIEPNGTVDLMLYLHPTLNKQQVLGKFFKADEPSIQSECVLYETK